MKRREYWPIQIGGKDAAGKRLFACSLETMGDMVAPDPEPVAWVAWADIADVVGFTQRERAVWFFQWQHGQSATMTLGLSPHQVGAANREIMRKLKDNVPAIRGLVGRGPQAEKYFFVTDPKRHSLAPTNEEQMEGTNRLQLTQRLAEETAKHQRLKDRISEADVTLRAAENNFSVIERGLVTAQARALVKEESWPTPDAERKLRPAREAIESAEVGRRAAREACSMQAEIVESIKGQIEAGRMESFKSEVAPFKVRLNELTRDLADVGTEIFQMASRYGVDPIVLGFVLFPLPARPEDRGLAHEEGARRALILNSALALQSWLSLFGRKV